ncbi:MAG: ribokinase [Phycisphaeraceae bacterium]|nr:ribokinase [Phycisphaeraceae bacterium]
MSTTPNPPSTPAQADDDAVRLCVFGSLNMDLVIRAPRFPTPGETIVGGRFARFPGGKGANQAVAAARLGAAVSMIGAVGDDEYGRKFMALLKAEGVSTRHIAVRPPPPAGAPTGVGVVTIDDSEDGKGQNSIVVALGANMTITPAEVDAAKEVISQADMLLMQLEAPLESIAHAAHIAKDAGATVLLNAAPAPAPGTFPPGLLADVDVLIVNEFEGRALRPRLDPADESTFEDELRALAGHGPRCAVLTLGDRGARVYFDKSLASIPAYPAASVDTVGAGDAFCAAFACRWAWHQIGGSLDALNVHDAACWGCAAGSIAVARHGAIPSLPTRGEVASMLRGGWVASA